ncbi:MAG: S-layer homology domain-containing protein [Firmicutes bacterium]|nr:S-layer homology domain-containing protein [Bacillota bacterium]
MFVLAAVVDVAPASAARETPFRYFHDEGEAAWAMQYMARASAKRILKGYPDGGFRPNASVTRTEVIVGVMRMLRETAGEGAGGSATAEPPGGAIEEAMEFEDSVTILEQYRWAAEDVGRAAYLGFVDPADGPFQPGVPAARWWIAEVLVKAAGLDGEAQDRMDEVLPFTDSPEVPAGKAGYVAVANSRGIMTGYGQTFGPAHPITRAEFATVLERCCEMLAPVRGREVRGVVTAVDAKQSIITMRKFDREWWPRTGELGYWDRGEVFAESVTMTLSPDLAVFVDGKEVATSSIKKGQLVAVVWNDQGFVVLVDARAKSPASWPEMGQSQKQGTVIEIARDYGPVLVFRDQTGKTCAYAVGSSCKVNRNGKTADLMFVKPRDRVTLKITDSTITAITAEEPEEIVEFEILIKWASLGDKPRLAGVDDRSVRREYRIALNCTVTRDGRASNLVELNEGDMARVRVTGGEITAIDVRSPEGTSEAEGIVREIKMGASPEIRIKDAHGNDLTYELLPECIARSGRALIALEDLKVGDRVILDLETPASGSAWNVKMITVRNTDEASGWVESIEAEWAPARMNVKLFSGTTLRAWVSPDAKIWRKGKAIELEKVSAGDRVKMSLLDGVITRIEAQDARAAIEGVVEKVEERRNRLTVKPQDEEGVTIALDSSTKITYLKQAITLGEIVVGDRVQVKMKDAYAASVDVEDRVPKEITGEITRVSTGTAARISIKPPEGGGTSTYTLAADVKIEYDGYPMTTADLMRGDRVTLTIHGSRVTRVSVERRPQSEVHVTYVSMITDLAEGYSLRVRNEKGAVVTYKVKDGAGVRKGTTDMELEDLVAGNLLALKLAGNVITQITVLQ